MADPFRLEVDGLREFNRAVRRSVDDDLPKRIGRANKAIGELVITRLRPRPEPAAVGAGRGAEVRASASKREVQLRVGGAHRKVVPQQQWGKNPVRSFRRAPQRPYIVETADRNYDEISDRYLTAIAAALDPAFD